MNTDMTKEETVRIDVETDIREALSVCDRLLASHGFGEADSCAVMTAVSELTRNMFGYAPGKGVMHFRVLDQGSRYGIRIIAEDQGPGIADLTMAMTDHVSTSGGLGLGLPGVKRMMDEFHIESTVGIGTSITVTKWA